MDTQDHNQENVYEDLKRVRDALEFQLRVVRITGCTNMAINKEDGQFLLAAVIALIERYEEAHTNG